MKRFLLSSVLVVVASLAITAGVQASQHAKSRPAVKAASAPRHSASGKVCPVSDPSQCPTGCARTATTAVVMQVAQK